MRNQSLILVLFFLAINTTVLAQQNDSTIIKITLPVTEDWKVDQVKITHPNPVFRELIKNVSFIQTNNLKNE